MALRSKARLSFIQVLVLIVATLSGCSAVRDTELKRLQDSCFIDPVNCAFAKDQYTWVQASPRCEFDNESASYPCAVKLGVSCWHSSFISSYIAKVFIEEFLGYPVEIEFDYNDYKADHRRKAPLADAVGHDGEAVARTGTDGSYGTVKSSKMWQAFESGEVDVMLEVWDSASLGERAERMFAAGAVVDAGSLGFTGQVGWYFLSSEDEVMGQESYDTLPVFLDSWRAYKLRSITEMFANSKALPLPCCPGTDSSQQTVLHCMRSEEEGGTPVSLGGIRNSSSCQPSVETPAYGGRFLAGNPDWNSHDSELISQLGLNLTIEQAWTEHEILRQITSTAADTGLLMYLWEPHPFIHKFNLTRVGLPHSTDLCQVGDKRCEYHQVRLYKVYSRQLAEDKPDLALLLDLFQHEDVAQLQELIGSVLYDSKNINDAALQWVNESIQIWEPWIKAVEDTFADTYFRKPTELFARCGCARNGTTLFAQYWLTECRDTYCTKGDPDPCAGTGVSTYTSRWKQAEFITNLITLTDCGYASPTSVTGTASIVISMTSITVLIVTWVVVVVYRKNRHMKAANVKTMSIFIAGAVTLNLYNVVNLGPATYDSCSMRYYTLAFGFTWFQGALILKELALYSIFSPTRRNVVSESLHRYGWAFLTSIGSVMSIFGALVNRFDPVPYGAFADYYSAYTGRTTSIAHKVDWCPKHKQFYRIGITLMSFTVVWSCYMAYHTRNINGAFSEGKYIFFTAYILLSMCLVGGLMFTVVSLNYETSALLASCVFSVCTLSAVAAIVGTRIYAIITDRPFDMNEIINNSRKHTKLPKVKSKKAQRGFQDVSEIRSSWSTDLTKKSSQSNGGLTVQASVRGSLPRTMSASDVLLISEFHC